MGEPSGASDDQLHFMVQAMESWFYADKEELGRFYGANFKKSALSGRLDIDNISKDDALQGLRNATRDCQKGEYSKGGHSFQILARIDPLKVTACSPMHADRLVKYLDRVLSSST